MTVIFIICWFLLLILLGFYVKRLVKSINEDNPPTWVTYLGRFYINHPVLWTWIFVPLGYFVGGLIGVLLIKTVLS